MVATGAVGAKRTTRSGWVGIVFTVGTSLRGDRVSAGLFFFGGGHADAVHRVILFGILTGDENAPVPGGTNAGIGGGDDGFTFPQHVDSFAAHLDLYSVGRTSGVSGESHFPLFGEAFGLAVGDFLQPYQGVGAVNIELETAGTLRVTEEPELQGGISVALVDVEVHIHGEVVGQQVAT